MMSNFTFNTQFAQRKDFLCCVNVNTSDSPEWEPIGTKVEESALEVDADSETITDILGVTWTTQSKVVIKQEFDPLPLKKISKFQQKLYDYWFHKNFAALSSIDALLLYKFAGVDAQNFDAERYESSAIAISSFGGSGSGELGMPISITFGGKRTEGKATINDQDVITFAAT